MLPLVWRKRRKESGWEREVVKRHRRAERRRRTPDRTRKERTTVTPATREAKGDEGVRASQGERTERGRVRDREVARGARRQGGRKGRVVSTYGTSSSCALAASRSLESSTRARRIIRICTFSFPSSSLVYRLFSPHSISFSSRTVNPAFEHDIVNLKFEHDIISRSLRLLTFRSEVCRERARPQGTLRASSGDSFLLA